MEISPHPVVDGHFIKRKNRFVAEVRLEATHQIVEAHVPNTGRMKELLVEGAKVGLAYSSSPKRKTAYTLITVLYHNIWVCIEAVAANRLIYQHLLHKPGIEDLKREVTYQDSRFDLARKDQKGYGYIEIKSVNLVIETSDHHRCACFPDAPTKRGTKHLEELIRGNKEHYHNALYFVVQRNDAECLVPNQTTDPEFSAMLFKAQNAGVEIRAFLCDVGKNSLTIKKEIPVRNISERKLY
ncbi:DNA/RNA nuclease SfsA [Pseudoramibacter sp.]|jgi:sugar fermentation stimulation protein A|uniref:DNA/RNA nuclease SfsA n=1 Tax=Pseudoramibacter sp. TaxID=2034862 RepID=UPI0025DDDD5E|nr:DNA/RNA nuclease SfsA [Pseudoramibacter sp.]MCH4072754.1 DNA/RNA nuclease SfsA [Pseudoramibacter sp.]MCH4106525.1 DNA/RNA nuclease SfsA [Pseudoramibacter sp.]